MARLSVSFFRKAQSSDITGVLCYSFSLVLVLVVAVLPRFGRCFFKFLYLLSIKSYVFSCFKIKDTINFLFLSEILENLVNSC